MNISKLHNLMDRLAHQHDESEEAVFTEQDLQLEEAISQHSEWADEMRSREQFDVQLCETLVDLDVPSGGKEKLLALVEADASATLSLNQHETSPHKRPSRRRAIGLFSAATLLFLISLGVFLSNLSPVLTVAGVEQNMPRLWDLSAEELVPANVDSRIVASLPTHEWETPRIRYQADWSPTQLDSPSEQMAAFRKFSFQSARGFIHNGLLVSLPASKFAQDEHPSASSPFSADIRYLSTPSGVTLAIVTWSNPQTDSVYFLAVPADTRTLEALDALLYVNPV